MPANVNECMRKLDVSGEGKISLNEFVAWCREIGMFPKKEPAEKVATELAQLS